jgi:hypothetical protein
MSLKNNIARRCKKKALQMDCLQGLRLRLPQLPGRTGGYLIVRQAIGLPVADMRRVIHTGYKNGSFAPIILPNN